MLWNVSVVPKVFNISRNSSCILRISNLLCNYIQFLTAIFVGSFKLSYDDIKKKLLQFDEEVITENALENFIKFLPNREQVGKLIYKHYWTDFDRTIFNFAFLRPYLIESSSIINCGFYDSTVDITEMSSQHLPVFQNMNLRFWEIIQASTISCISK